MRHSTKVSLLIVALFAVVVVAFGNTPSKANKQLTNTNFVCQMQGKWSNEHYNVSEVKYLGNGDWQLSYPDNEIRVIYHQRQGEDCGTETYTIQE